ncbi:MAG: heavy metal-responsive transcriptional regulator [Deltaproteobacteria bacterium]|nr:heavy metal-responsive transcriptional regulator [Deltaproteobacteria bacterium]
MGNLTIGQLARRAGVNLETIRYYERRGLIPEAPRNQSGYRQYSQEDVTRTKFIKRAQALGFSLKEVAELLSLRMEPGMSCGDVKARVDVKIEEVESRIKALEYVRKALLGLSERCTGRGPAGDCPFLKELEAVDMEMEAE